MNSDLIVPALTITAVTLLVVIVILAVSFLFLRERVRSRFDDEKRRAELSYLRVELEHELRNINERLTASQARFEDINHLLVSSQKFEPNPLSTPQQIHLSRFLKEAGVTEQDRIVEDDFIFVLTPFHKDYQESYDAIKSVCLNVSLRCARGDERRAEGDILTTVLKSIARARLIVANIGGRNPNVYYELGMAHVLDKPVLLVAHVKEKIPFNLQSMRTLLYQNQDDLKAKLLSAMVQIFSVKDR